MKDTRHAMGEGLRVAWFGHSPDRRGNGVVTYSREITRCLREAGADVLFFYHGREMAAPSPGAIGLQAAFRWNNQDVISTPASHRRVAQALQAGGVDLGHVSFTFSLSLDWQVPRLLHRMGRPAVATLHFPFGHGLTFWSLVSWLVYQIYLPILRQYDALIVLGEGQKDILSGSGVREERVYVLPNAVDVRRFTPGPSDYKEVVGARWMPVYCGRLDPEKQVDELLRVFTSLGLPEDHKLVLVGDGTQGEQLRAEYGRDPRVIFTGHLSDEGEVIRILRAADCFVLPSAVEGLSLALLEAMACGAAPVVTEAGADGDVVRGVGLVMRSDRLEKDLREALLRLAREPELGQQMGRAARERVVRDHDIRRQTEELIALYRALVQERTRGEGA